MVGSRRLSALSRVGLLAEDIFYMEDLDLGWRLREIALDVVRLDGSVLPCLMNAVEVRGEDDRLRLTERRQCQRLAARDRVDGRIPIARVMMT